MGDCTFCPLPWNSLNMRNNGDLRICCNTNSYTENRGILRKEDGKTPYNAGKDDWNEARNSDVLKEVRSAMLKGEWHPECERCRQEEANGLRSRREYESDDWGKWYSDTTLEKVLPYTKEDGTIDTDALDFEYLDIRYGNFCNLKCRMCGPTDSHQWYDDYTKLYDTTKFTDTNGKVQLEKNEKGRWVTDNYSWFSGNNQYWHYFEKYAPDAKKLYIVGGEPLIIPEHQESLERLVASGKSKDIQLEYNTNLTMVPDRLIYLWEQFKQIRIGVSIDGCNEVFDYQRTPAKFDAVYKNMLRLQENDNINLKAWFAFTVTPFNVFHLPEFMKWKLEESGLTKFNPNDGHRPIVSQHMCHSPKHYNIKVLPPEIKKQVSLQYLEYKNWIDSTGHTDRVKKQFYKVLDGVEKFMLSENYHDVTCNYFNDDRTWLYEFVRSTIKLDEIRNQNILDIVPQYRDLFNAHNERES